MLVALVACGQGEARLHLNVGSSGFPAGGNSNEDVLGTPGVDYDPSVLVVHYADGARVPSKLASLAPPPGKRASEQPFATVRKYAQYEKLTDAAAVVAGAEIERQAYIDGMRMAALRMPAGTDPEAARRAIIDSLGSAVESVEYARIVHAMYTTNDPDFTSSSATSGPQWGLKKIGCEEAWDITTGIPSVRIAVCDTGVRITHEELQGHVLDPQVAFPSEHLDVANADNTVEDDIGHGSFIAGLICAEQNNGRTITGVAPGCEVIPIKIANTGSTSDYLMAMGVSLAVELGANVINLSWGGPSGSPTMQSMVETAYTNGVLLVVAAGNDNTAAESYPGAYENCLCVGATRSSDARSSFSNYGDYVDIAAPGEWLKSCLNEHDSDYEPYGAGTSYAAPIVAAAAGLIWSYSPQLNLADVRQRLMENTAPTTGFSATNPVGRLDIPAALGTIEELGISAPKLDALIHNGVVFLEPTVTGQPETVEMYVDDELIDSKSVAPYMFSYDTTPTQFGILTVDFATVRGGQRTFVSLDLLVDNTAGILPLNDGFEEPAAKQLVGLDLKHLDPVLLGNIKTVPPAQWTADELAAGGPAVWMPQLAGAQAGSRCMYFGQGGSYGAFELDALVSRKVDLSMATAPVLAFHHHYNIEDAGAMRDRALLYATSDGVNLTHVLDYQGAAVCYTGLQEDWAPVELDLAQFAGQKVSLVWLFEGDGETAGEDPAQAAGWWLDSVAVFNSLDDGLPHVLDQVIEPGSVLGLVPQATSLNLGLFSTMNVAQAAYTVDLAPVGEDGPNDIASGWLENANFICSLPVPTDAPNQACALVVEYASEDGTPGEPLVIPLVLYNLRGDCDGDGVVGDSDLALLAGGIGLASGQPGFDPLLDTDGDGIITELDAAYLAYFWGQ